MHVIRALFVLGVIALAVVAVRARLRRRDDPGQDGIEAGWTPVAVPVEATRAQVPVAVPVGAPDDRESPFAPGSAAPDTDGTGPAGWTVKAKESSRLYHTPSSPSWERMHPDAWFESEAAAQAAGFKRWDWRRNSS